MKKKNIILYIIVIVVAVAATLVGLRYKKTVTSMLSSKEVLNTKTPIVNAVTLENGIVAATGDGIIYFIDNTGKVTYEKDLKTSIYYLGKSPDNNYIVVGSIEFTIFDKSGKVIFTKGVNNYIAYKGQFIDGGKIKLVFQSLSDLSYTALTVDMKGKVLETEKINDLAESNFVDISSAGRIIYGGERGELYLIENGSVLKNFDIDTKVSTIHNIFCYFVGKDLIVAGYRNSDTENPSIPVYFFDANLTQINKVDFNGQINNVTVNDNDTVTFSTDQGIYTYSNKGKQISSRNEFGFGGYYFSENDNSKMYAYFKQTGGTTASFVYKIDLTDSSGNEVGTYLYPSGSLPEIFLSDNTSLIIFIDKNIMDFIYSD
jgi:hypothetical protein